MTKTAKVRAKTEKKQSSKQTKKFLKQGIPYMLMFLVALIVAVIGTKTEETTSVASLNMTSIASSNYSVSADQLSQFYTIASISSSFNLDSTETVASNYVALTSMREIGQTSTDKIEKPSVVNTNLSRGVATHTVRTGESMESIASQYGLTTDQIRWSNDLKNTDVSVGQTLVISSSVPGIVYTVKSGDSVESLASKYGSSEELIVSANDLETTALSEGMQIVLPNGVLPTTERPEYVAPTYYRVATYTYYGSTSERISRTVVGSIGSVGGYGWGQCTSYAYWWRSTNGRRISSQLGNANQWDDRAGIAGLSVSRTPTVGAIFQTDYGYYGHVGIVTGINEDGSITVREANYMYATGVVTESTIPANIVGNFKYLD